MAITAAKKTSDFSGFLSREQSDYIFEKAALQSVVQKNTRRIPLGINGQSIPYVSGKMTAGWVGEGATKPASHGAIALKTMDPKKIAAVTVVSAEVVRANPGNYMNLVRDQISEAFATAFDSATLHGVNTPFSTYIDQATATQELGVGTAGTAGAVPVVTDLYGDLNLAMGQLINANKYATGWLFDNKTEILFNAAKDSTGRPLFNDAPYTQTASPVNSMASDVTYRSGQLLGRPAQIAPNVFYDAGTTEIFGYVGDWSQAVWGAVGGISYSVSTEATVTINGSLVSLWENNLVAILAEAEYGFLVNDTASFVKIINTTS